MLWSGWKLQYVTVNSNGQAGEAAADVAIAFVDSATLSEGAAVFHPAFGAALEDLEARGSFQGKKGQTVLLPTLGTIPEKYMLYIGCGALPLSAKAIREAAGSAGDKLLELKAESVSIAVPSSLADAEGDRPWEAAGAAFMEGLLLGLYRRDSLSARGRERSALAKLTFKLESGHVAGDWNEGAGRGIVSADAVCYARELTNAAGNRLTPAILAEEAQALSERYGLDCRVYNEEEAAAEGMGGLLAVGAGSANAPRMIVIRHVGNPASSEILGLVGKGITFDTGGISLKKPLGMEEMISDMGGAAAVLGAMRGVGVTKPAVNVVAVIPAAENMPSGSAFKPGDIVRTYGGQTVEILNTDAEGRVVLADGLTVAIRHGATRLIDVATLTGAVMHALGDLTTGALTNDETTLSAFLQAAERAGEYVWQLPSHPEYRRMLKSDVADLKNHGGTWAGAIAGGLFVGAFAEERPWIHLDIGGTTWMWETRGFEGKGGTGVMVRTLLEYIRS